MLLSDAAASRLLLFAEVLRGRSYSVSRTGIGGGNYDCALSEDRLGRARLFALNLRVPLQKRVMVPLAQHLVKTRRICSAGPRGRRVGRF